MIVAFLANLNIRPLKAQYLDTFYKMLSKFNNQDIHYIITKEYLDYYPNMHANKILDYNSIDWNEVNYTTIDIPNDICQPIKKQIHNYNLDFNYNLERKLQEIIKEIGRKNIDYIITWINNANLNLISNDWNIPLIHNELGPLRPNLWNVTCYFDFTGVNCNTDFKYRLLEFLKISDNVELFSHEELLSLAAKDKESVLNIYNNRDKADKIGVALQVARDINLIAYNNGWHIKDIVNYAYNKYDAKDILIKNHPFSLLQHIGEDDDSYNFKYAQSPEELLYRSKKIITINSSMAFEALLLGKEVEILGCSPFRYLLDIKDSDDYLKALNFIVISYLIPSYLLFNKDYYDFRLECKDEIELYNYGLKLLQN